MLTNEPQVQAADILTVLQALSSQDPAVFKGAEEQLKQLGELQGTWDFVHQHAARRELPLDLRKQALIQFKNSGATRWRSRKLFNDDNRTKIRLRCFEFLDEADEALSETNAVVFAKLARADFPQAWPTLTHDLRQLLEVKMQVHLATPELIAPSTVLRRVLRVMTLIVKEISAMKMLTGVKAMQQLIDQWFTMLVQCYSAFWEHINSGLAAQVVDDPATTNLVILHTIFKVLSKMSIWLWSRMDKPGYTQVGPMLLEFFQNYKQQWSFLSDLRTSRLQAFSESALQIITKHIIGLSKTFRKWQRISADRFFQLPESSTFVLAHWQIAMSASQSDSLFSEGNPYELYPLKLVIVGMALFKESVSKWASSKQQHAPVLGEEFVQKAVETIITRFLPLKSDDLTKWEEDPEEWAGGEEIDEEAWEFGIRPCSERVLMVLTRHYSQYAVPALQHGFAVAYGSGDILLKEAIYCAMGCCVQQLRDQLNFNDMLEARLSQEVMSSDSITRILKRRIAWLIGKWVESTDDVKPTRLVWELLTSLLTGRSENTDPVVHMSVIIAIKQCADSSQFGLDSFTPFIGDIVQGSIKVALSSETVELKQKVLSTLDVVIQRAGNLIVPFAEVIVKVVPVLWSQAENAGNFLIKGCLLVSLRELVMSLKDSQPLCSFIVPLLQESFAPKNRTALEEDALQLWLVSLRNASSIGTGQPDYLDLFPFAIQCLTNNLDIMGTMVLIIESYLLLNVEVIMTQFSEALLTAFDTAMSVVLVGNIKDLMKALNLLASLYPIQSWAQQLLSTGLFAHIIKNILDDKITALVLTEHIYVLARIAISEPSILLQLIASVAAVRGMLEGPMLNDLLDQWWLKFDNMSEPAHRKLTAMGAACLVATGRDEVLQRLPSEIFNLWLDCFGEIREAESEEGSALQLHWQTGDAALNNFLQESEGTVEESRRRQCFANDPVQITRLVTFVGEKLNIAQAACGGPEVFKARYLESAEPLLMQQIEKELTD